MKKMCVVLILALYFLLPGLASAVDSAGYWTLKLGYFMPNDDKNGLKNFDNMVSAGLIGGVKLSPNIAIEIGGDYYYTEGNDTVSAAGASYSVDAKVMIWSIPVTGKFILPLSDQVDVFIGGGLG